MSLQEYRRKRDFGRTREPEPGKPAPLGKRAIFVVQLHHASRRHYDFRLQVGDTLKSWAVPKGPSFDPKVKRLAAEVEDHPVSYAKFEGMIPEGQYGGGHVALFDDGVWATQGDPEAQLAKGHLRFELFGRRLKGGWHLVRTQRSRSRQPEWLLFKDDDAHAGKLEADDLLAGVTSPPLDSKGAKQMPAKQRAVLKKPGAAQPAVAKKATAARRKAMDWKTAALALPGARPAKLKDEAFAPQLARLRSHPPAGADWLHEIKWDGYRILATLVGGRARLWSRNAIEWTAKLPEVVQALERLGVQQAALDGELIAAPGDQASFSTLQSTLSGERNAALSYVLFDLPHLDGISLERAPLLARKELLQRLLGVPQRPLAYSSHAIGDGEAAFAMASRQGFEGIISKRIERPYSGGRGDDWVKVKRLESDEFAVVGVTPPKGARAGLGSLLLARPDDEHGWRYAGRVGTGFSDEQLRDVARRLGREGAARPSVYMAATDTDLRQARWFAPRFVVEVYTRGLGNQGLLRQPSLKALRFDKDPDDLRDSDRGPAMKKTAGKKAAKTATKKAAAKTPAKKTVARPSTRGDGEAGGYRISSPERIVYPDAGITKQQVADYYLAVADKLLEEIEGRPLSIVRCPDGAAQACFFQKHHTPGLAAVGSARLKEESGRNANYLVVEDLDGLMALVQFNALEFHPWGAKAKTPDQADRIVFDLDPGPGVEWPVVKKAAIKVRELLAQLDLVSFLRTSGGKGLHVVAPLNPGCSWTLVKRFARGFAEAMAQAEPERFVATATKSLRDGRIFVDYLRNGRGATSVASYSLRARAGAPVAVPLAWSELARLPRANHFDLHSLPRRLARLKADPWADIDRVKQDLSRWSGGTASRRKRR
jgi:bifunctional non-homologous end joining protein LigD